MSNHFIKIQLEKDGCVDVETNFTADDCEVAMAALCELHQRIINGEWKSLAVDQGKKQPIPDESDGPVQVWHF